MGIKSVLITGVMFLGALTEGYIVTENADYPMPFTKNTEVGRTKNSISAVIAGTVAEKFTENSKNPYDKSLVYLDIKKAMWPDAHVTGFATKDSIATDINDLTFSSVHYNAKKRTDGYFSGCVEKSEFNWDIDQMDINKYYVHRALLKFDSNLILKVEDGIIAGVYERRGLAYDWKIFGHYDENGAVKIHVDVPLGMDFDLEGKIINP